ncbi:MAG: hypothetical protein KJ852_18530 [Gammaproteobacteria bacterium]|nr:hypothetical protein [Gammaproteobacteria bacterium]MBU0813572.1 hypothetical protein [Gammaproteobacteria bacterium]MBU1788957.1 hypothetical protein [Gammaproteobacteria bacterium]
MKYIIRKAVIARVPEIEISVEEYLILQQARNVLISALAIEEKYEILIANFLALEKELLHVAATNMVRQAHSYTEFFETQSILNICIVNLLTSARLYLDQLPQDVADCAPENLNAASLVKERCSKEYDENFEYRFMEALRNHVQHRGIPIHRLNQGGQWTSHEDDALISYTVDIIAQRSRLAENKKFKKSILNEMPEDVDLKIAGRRYVESLSAINEFARSLISMTVESARERVKATHTRYSEVYSESLIGLAASEINNGNEVTSVPLLLDWDDVRIKLQRRNTQLVNLGKRYSTGEPSRKIN